jgi:transcriptional regulator with XRE-family HTH domain
VLANDYPMPCMPLAALRKTTVTALAFACLAGTGGDTGLQYFINRKDQGYAFTQVDGMLSFASTSMLLEVRTTLATLNRIRDVLRLSISDLALACTVSRQAVYKWISGSSSSLAQENQRRLDDLYRASELFATRGVVGSAVLLKRKNNSGLTLVQAMQAGESAQTWARATLDTIALESQQRAMLDDRLRARKRPATESQEWGVPMMNEIEA